MFPSNLIIFREFLNTNKAYIKAWMAYLMYYIICRHFMDRF
jgi:hypothetical protein